jgi:hypothetical protein
MDFLVALRTIIQAPDLLTDISEYATIKTEKKRKEGLWK